MELERAPDSSAYFSDYGDTLIKNGYHIIPIQPGEKRPHPQLVDWPKLKIDEAKHREMVRQGFGKCGVGIITSNVPAIDVDVEDPDVVAELSEFITALLGDVPCRVGNAPKSLFMCRTKRPFRKMMSKKFDDGWGGTPRVEILGEGQQFVAFHVHPKTRLPYNWTSELDPYNTRLEELPVLSEDMAIQIIAKFEELAEIEGWTEIEPRSIRRNSGLEDDDDPFAADSPKADISKEVLKELLNHIPSTIQNDDWVRVGMGLYHQFDGSDEGLDMWKEWSEFGYDDYDERECTNRWRSFDISCKGRTPTTVRTIIEWAKEYIQDKNMALLTDLVNKFDATMDYKAWSQVAKECRKSTLDSIQRDALVEVARNAYYRLTKLKLPAASARKQLEFEHNIEGIPGWCANWVWVSEDERFFNVKTKIALSKQGFDATFMREAKTKKDVIDDKDTASKPASVLALAVYGIPKVDAKMYSPRHDLFFNYQGREIVNTYDRDLCPVVPEKMLPRDKRNIERVKKHVEHLIEDPREQRLLISWLAFVVQNPGRKVNWAVLLQGTEGDGKSFFACLLRAVLGQTNVSMLNASSFKSDFTGWAVGQCVTAVEEIRLQGEGKFDILNKIKPYITNDIVEIHAKGKTQFNAENTTNYMLFTNFQDAMPLTNNDRRYFVLFSRWQSKDLLSAFRDEHPDYYMNLYNAIAESAGAIRGWLLDVELDEEFQPRGDAPKTVAHDIMVNSALAEEYRAMLDFIADDKYEGISHELVNLTQLNDAFRESELDQVTAPRWNLVLSREGWFPLEGRIKVKGRACKFYSPVPHKFTINGQRNGRISVCKIMDYLTSRPQYVEPDPFDEPPGDDL